MASDVGTIGLSQEEANALRLYLQKGGFLWVDDFWRGSVGAVVTRTRPGGYALGINVLLYAMTH
jgi:hypothetical protein